MGKMGKLLLGILVAVLTVTSAGAEDFRKVSWGASPAEIEAAEGKKADHKSAKGLIYMTTLAGMKCMVMYGMKNGKLQKGVYSFEERRPNHQLFIDDYNKIDALLEKKYGNGKVLDTWSSNIYKSDSSKHGSALWLGHVSKMTSFESGENLIAHTMSNSGKNINHYIMYQSQASMRENSKEVEQSALDDL